MRRCRDITGMGTVDAYATWLAGHRAPDALAAEAGRLFEEKGPSMPRRMRLDLGEFLRERSVSDLARLVAMNVDPRDDAEFVEHLRRTGPDRDFGF